MPTVQPKPMSRCRHPRLVADPRAPIRVQSPRGVYTLRTEGWKCADCGHRWPDGVVPMPVREIVAHLDSA